METGYGDTGKSTVITVSKMHMSRTSPEFIDVEMNDKKLKLYIA